MTLEERDEQMREEGRQEEREKRLEAERAAAKTLDQAAKAIRTIMDIRKLSATEAMDLLDIPNEERSRYLSKLS